MSAFTLSLANKFPEDTSVGAYPVSNWAIPGEPSGAPKGEATSTTEVEGGDAAFTALEENTPYWVVGQVGGSYRYVLIFIPIEEEEGGAGGVDESEMEELLDTMLAARVGVTIVGESDPRLEADKAEGMGVIEHGSNAEYPRGSNYARYEWIGTVFPKNALKGDEWYDPTGAEVEE